MNFFKEPMLLPIVFILCAFFKQSYQICYSIKNPKSGFVLDAAENEVKIRYFDGNKTQLWKLEPAESYTNYIINVGNGKVLDKLNPWGGISQVVTRPKNGGASQHWIIKSDEIADNQDDYILDICREEYYSGNSVLTYSRRWLWTAHQKFVLMKQHGC